MTANRENAMVAAGTICAYNKASNKETHDNLITLRAPFAPSPGFRAAFNDNARPAQPAKNYDALDLWDKVHNNGGKVSPEEARAFVDYSLRGRFTNDSRITDARAKSGLHGLDFETQVTLYEQIAKEDAPERSVQLRELNKAMDPGPAFYEKRVENVKNFFDAKNTAYIEQKWALAKATGKIPATAGSFADTMEELMGHPPILAKEDYVKRIAILQFIGATYSEYIGEDNVKIGIFQGPPGLKGFHTGKDAPQGEVIGINLTELHDFKAALNVLIHERQHASQDRLAEKLQQGKIKKGDPDYVAARLFAANRAEMGYLSPDQPAGPAGYVYQPMEIDAHNAGHNAEYFATRTYARPPRPHTEHRPHLRAA